MIDDDVVVDGCSNDDYGGDDDNVAGIATAIASADADADDDNAGGGGSGGDDAHIFFRNLECR